MQNTQSKILFTGGNGKLATELKKHLKGDYLSKKDFDFTKPIKLKPEANQSFFSLIWELRGCFLLIESVKKQTIYKIPKTKKLNRER